MTSVYDGLSRGFTAYVLAAGHGTGVCIAGKVDSGYVQVGENVYILPAQEVVSIKCECHTFITYIQSLLISYR